MNLQDLGATEIIGICVLALAVVGFLKGLMRTVMALVCLGIAGYAALWGNEHAHDFTASWSAIPSLWAPKIVALITGLVVFFICRYILNFLVDPFNDSKTGQRIGFGLPAAALSLCAGLILIWLGFTGIRYAASLSELRDTQRMILLDQSETLQQTSALILKAQRALDKSTVGLWQRSSDPFYTSGKLALSKLLVMYHHEPTRIKLLKNPQISQLLNHPQFIELAYCADLKQYAKSGKPREIFNSSALNKALSQTTFKELFGQLDLNLLEAESAQPSSESAQQEK